jgi:hypothetical protein
MDSMTESKNALEFFSFSSRSRNLVTSVAVQIIWVIFPSLSLREENFPITGNL